MFPIQAHNAYILTLEPFGGNTREGHKMEISPHKKVAFSELALLGDPHVLLRDTWRHCGSLCLHFSPLIYSFFFLPSLHKENKKSAHCADVCTQEESFFFFFSGIIIPFFDSENRRTLFLGEIPKYFFILIASYWRVFGVHSDELHRHFNSSMPCALTIFSLPDVLNPSPRQSHLRTWDLGICINLGSTNKRNIKTWYLSF